MYQIQHQRQSPIKITDLCFRCRKPGHWAINCPENPNYKGPVLRPVNCDQEFPISFHCRCGAGLCVISFSGSIKYPNRKCYRCPGYPERDCGYVRWCDELKREEIRDVQPNPYPMCGCGAGISIVQVDKYGANAGRSYFACPVKKGDGACNFKQWLDDSPETISVTSGNPVADHSSALCEFDFSNEAQMQLDAAEIAACEIPMEKDNQIHIEGEEDKMPGACGFATETLEAHLSPVVNSVSKNLDYEMTIQRSETIKNQMYSSKVDNMQVPATSLTTFLEALNKGPLLDSSMKAELQYLMAILSKNPSSAGQNVCLYPQSVTTSAVSSLFSSPENSPSSDPETIDRIQLKPPTVLKDNLQEGTIMTSTISAAFDKLALNLQNDLIVLLDSMDPHNHAIMTKEAESTFAALNSVQVDYKLFHAKVNEYIKQAASLAHTDQIMKNNLSSEDLVVHRDNEQRRFEELLKRHQEANDAFRASNNQFSLLCEKASCVGRSDELAVELLSCEAEIAARREKLIQITKSMAECKESLQTASLKAEEALQISEKRESERNAAWVAFQTAKAGLRN